MWICRSSRGRYSYQFFVKEPNGSKTEPSRLEILAYGVVLLMKLIMIPEVRRVTEKISHDRSKLGLGETEPGITGGMDLGKDGRDELTNVFFTFFPSLHVLVLVLYLLVFAIIRISIAVC